MEALEERYDRCKTVYLHHVKKIETQGPIAYNHASLRESLGFIQDQYQGLVHNKGPSLDEYLAAHLELLMDDTCKSHWGVYSAKNRLPPTMENVCEFLKERMYTLPEEPAPTEAQTSTPPPKTKAVATDFEVVRPGNGCGLFHVGVVFICRCGLFNVGVVLFDVSVEYNGVTMD